MCQRRWIGRQGLSRCDTCDLDGDGLCDAADPDDDGMVTLIQVKTGQGTASQQNT